MPLAGCGGEVPGSVHGPLVVSRVAAHAAATTVRGELTRHAGCLGVDRHPAIWPVGTTWNGRPLRLRDGSSPRFGDRLRGTARLLDVESVSRTFEPDVGLAMVACAPQGTRVVVFSEDAHLRPVH